MTNQSQTVAIRILLGTLFVVLACVHLSWAWEDQAPQPIGDTYVYLAKLLNLIDGIGSQGLANFWSSLGRLSHGGRPPMYQLLTTPFILLFGRSEDVALCVNLVFMAILMISTYNIGRLVKNKTIGLLAALLVTTYPPILHLSRMYLPHFALSACFALSLWMIMSTMKDRSARTAVLFGASLALGFLVHPRFLRIAVVPTAVMGIYTLFFQTQPRYPTSLRNTWPWLKGKLGDRFVIFGLLPGALIALAPTLLWYLTHGLRIFGTFQKLTAPNMIEFAGKTTITIGFPEARPHLSLWYALTAPGAISNVLALCALAGLLSVAIRPRLLTSTLAISLIAAYAMLSWAKVAVYSWWHFSAALPVVATLTAYWVTSFRHRWISYILTVLCIAVALFNFSFVTWGAGPRGQKIATILGSPLKEHRTCGSRRTTAFCPAPAEAERWPLLEIQQTILADPDCQEARPCQLMTITSGRGFSAALLRHSLIKYQNQGRLKIVLQGFRMLLQPYNLAGLLKSDYLLYPERSDHGSADPDDSYIEISTRFLNSPPSTFAAAHQEIARFSLPNNRTAKLVKRIRPLTIREAEDSFAALELPEINKSQKHKIMADLYSTSGDWKQALQLYEEAVSQAPDSRALAKALRGLSRIYRAMGKPELAGPLYERMLEINPRDANAHIYLARIYAGKGNVEGAIARLETAIALTPEKSWPRVELANVFLSSGELDRAIALCREALALNPKDLTARMRLAEAYKRTGDRDAAIRELETAIALSPESTWPRRVLARYTAR